MLLERKLDGLAQEVFRAGRDGRAEEVDLLFGQRGTDEGKTFALLYDLERRLELLGRDDASSLDDAGRERDLAEGAELQSPARRQKMRVFYVAVADVHADRGHHEVRRRRQEKIARARLFHMRKVYQ